MDKALFSHQSCGIVIGIVIGIIIGIGIGSIRCNCTYDAKIRAALFLSIFLSSDYLMYELCLQTGCSLH
jgi:hypothetical protein